MGKNNKKRKRGEVEGLNDDDDQGGRRQRFMERMKQMREQGGDDAE